MIIGLTISVIAGLTISVIAGSLIAMINRQRVYDREMKEMRRKMRERV